MSREMRSRRQFEGHIIPALEGADVVGYSLVGRAFLVTAFGMLRHSVNAGAILAIAIARYLLGRCEVTVP
jgi:hypothetical protein